MKYLGIIGMEPNGEPSGDGSQRTKIAPSG